MDLNNDATLEKYVLAKNDLDAKVKEALGDQRFADYKRGEDPDFHQLNATVSRFNVPREKASAVYEMKRTLLDTRVKVLADNTLSPEQKEQALKEMAAETEKAVRETLGAKAYNYYAQSGFSQWIK